MSGMVEVLEEHDDDSVQDGYWFCDCGHEYGVFGGFGKAKADHVAAMLTAAGFGDAAEAKAQALEEAAGVIEGGAGKVPGVIARWLRARAAAVRGER
jgi:hypothetical protein